MNVCFGGVNRSDADGSSSRVSKFLFAIQVFVVRVSPVLFRVTFGYLDFSRIVCSAFLDHPEDELHGNRSRWNPRSV